MGSRFFLLFMLSQLWSEAYSDNCRTCLCKKEIIDCSAGRFAVNEGFGRATARSEALFLDRNSIKVIPNSLLQELMTFKALSTLSLADNHLEHFPIAILHKLQLKSLNLEENELSSFDVSPSDKFNTLLDLNLHSNNFTHVPSSLCQSFPFLEKLDLSENNIAKISSSDFRNCSRLQQLILSGNRISIVEHGAFMNLGEVKTLDLRGNRLTEITKIQSIFSHLSSLTSLDLSSNSISSLESLCFVGLTSLQILNLSGNALSNMQSATFYHLGALQTLDLSHNKLRQLLNGTFFGLGNLTSLIVSFNSIETLGGNLPLQFLQSLSVLDLSHNLISKVLAVGTAPELRSVNLSHNWIASIENSAFANLISLQQLDLAQNSLYSFEKSAQIFVALSNLQSLNLSSNPIKSIPGLIFSELSNKLQYLSLKNTSLSTLPQKSFSADTFPNLRRFEVSTDNFYCDCNIAWITQWLYSASFDAFLDIRCAYPESLREKNLFQVKPSDLKCWETSARPQVVTKPISHSVLKDQQTSFLCVAKCSGSVQSPTMDWTVNAKRVEPGPEMGNVRVDTEIDEIKTADGEVTVIMSSKLTLVRVSNDDEGSYTCSAHNEFGSSFADAADLVVNVKPYFTLPPKNVTSRVNSSVELLCEAGGDPKPEIKFNKDHNGIFPAALEKRLQYLGVKYYIRKVQLRDAGVYTCVAINTAGNISRDFYVNVLEMPEFERKLSDIDATEGDNVVVPCLNRGVPKPVLLWQKDGKTLNDLNGQNVSSDGVEIIGDMLVIRNVKPRHSGVYTCIIQNQIGIARDSSNIRIYAVGATGANKGGKDEEGVKFFDYFSGEGSSWSVTAGVIIIIAVCCVVITSFIWVCILYLCKKKSRGQTYSYDRSVDGTSFILRSGTAINASNLGTKQKSASKGGESGSLSCASTSMKESEAAFHVIPASATTHYFSNDSSTGDCVPVSNRQQAGLCYSPASQADRHFLSGPLISSAVSYDNFISPNQPHINTAAAEHSGASFNSLEISDAFVASPAPVPFLVSPVTHESSFEDAQSRSHVSVRSRDNTSHVLSRDPSQLLPAVSLNSQIRASAEHSEHSTGATSELSSRVSPEYDPSISIGSCEHPSSSGHAIATSSGSRPLGIPETPSYLRHYTRFHDHNYQPNVNVMDLDDVNMKAHGWPLLSGTSGGRGHDPKGGASAFRAMPAVSRSSSHINQKNRSSLNFADEIGLQSTDTMVISAADTSRGVSVSVESSSSTGGRTEGSSVNSTSKCSQPVSKLSSQPIHASQVGFLTTGRVTGKRKGFQQSDLRGMGNSMAAYYEKGQIASGSQSRDDRMPRQFRARPNGSKSGGSKGGNQTRRQLGSLGTSHRSEHDLRSLAVQLSVASQRDLSGSTPPSREPPRPPRGGNTSSVHQGNSNSGETNAVVTPTDRHTSSSSSASQHNSNA